MKSHLLSVSVGVVLAVLASGCGAKPPADMSGGTSGGQQPAGHVDVGGSVEFNILVVKLKLWMTIRDADVLVVEAYDWATRQVLYLVNGQKRTVTLTEEQAAEVKRAVESRNSPTSAPSGSVVPTVTNGGTPKVAASGSPTAKDRPTTRKYGVKVSKFIAGKWQEERSLGYEGTDYSAANAIYEKYRHGMDDYNAEWKER